MPGLFDDLYKDYLKDNPFGDDSVFGEKFRGKSQQEDEDRHLEVENKRNYRGLIKASGEQKNDFFFQKYGSTVYFVFIDNALNDSQRKQIVKNANDILSLNNIHAQVVGLKPLDVYTKHNCNFQVKTQGGTSLTFIELLENTTSRVVWIVGEYPKPEGPYSTGGNPTGDTPNELESFIYIDSYNQWDLDPQAFHINDKRRGFDLLMHIARTALHEMSHQILLRGKGNIHTWDESHHYEMQKIVGSNDSEYAIRENEDIERKTKQLLSIICKGENLFSDYHSNSWQKKTDDPPTKNGNMPPYYNIMSDGEAKRVRYPNTNKNDFTKQRMFNTYLKVDAFIVQLFFKLGLGFPQGLGDSASFTNYLLSLYKNQGPDGMRMLYRYIMAQEPNNLIEKRDPPPGLFNRFDLFNNSVIEILDTFNYPLNPRIKKV